MNLFIQQLIEDLKEFSIELLAPGLHTPQEVNSNMGTIASTAALLKSIDHLTGLIPQLVSDLQTTDATHKVMLHYTNSPKRATFSNRASDYQQDSQRRLVPSRWLHILPVPEADIRPLRWLLYLLELQQVALDKVQKRTTKYIDNSLLSQQGVSNYAQEDRATLLNMRARLNEARSKLEHARLALQRTVELKFAPSPELPSPFPRSPVWTHLRLFAQQLLNPTNYLPSFLQNLLQGTVEIADTPYLYQRWCGVKLLSVFNSLGWVWHDEPTGALFLGGQIPLYKSGVEISIWVEPRFSKYRAHPSGFSCQEVVETHPDYLIVTPGLYGTDAFILDPTTTADIEIRQTKSKYLKTIEHVGTAVIAGIPVPMVRNPLRAWAAAPIHSQQCEIHDDKGEIGTVPMHPLYWLERPLREWLKDVDNHALAWGKKID
jgi:hypothetical protein